MVAHTIYVTWVSTCSTRRRVCENEMIWNIAVFQIKYSYFPSKIQCSESWSYVSYINIYKFIVFRVRFCSCWSWFSGLHIQIIKITLCSWHLISFPDFSWVDSFYSSTRIRTELQFPQCPASYKHGCWELQQPNSLSLTFNHHTATHHTTKDCSLTHSVWSHRLCLCA